MNLNAITSKIIEFETEGLSMGEATDLFVDLLNSGLAWKLQGFYGRMAQDFLDKGWIVKPSQTEPYRKAEVQ